MYLKKWMSVLWIRGFKQDEEHHTDSENTADSWFKWNTNLIMEHEVLFFDVSERQY